MELPGGQGLHDHELDRPIRRKPRVSDLFPHEVQRLVANPFLALVGLVAWACLLRLALRARNLPLTLVLFCAVGGVVFLLQYHCLDCGRTGWLFRWRSHACERVRARRLAGQVVRFRGPNPISQTLLWFFLLLTIAILAAVRLVPAYLDTLTQAR